MGQQPLQLRVLEAADHDGIDRVAKRMRATLVEVLGKERGSALYTLDWLRGRVCEHLEMGADRACVWLAEDAEGHGVGQLIVRCEQDAEERAVPPIQESSFGLVSTIYVEPERRRLGVAQRLLDHAEDWMRARDLPWAATHTGQHNDKLIRLFESRGYALTLRTSEMVRLTRRL